jgi:beta-glucosidase
MADWGGTVSVDAAAAGLDQQSGEQLDHAVWFDQPLRQAVAAGEVAAERVSDMARRILRSMFAAGLFDRPTRNRGADRSGGSCRDRSDRSRAGDRAPQE